MLRAKPSLQSWINHNCNNMREYFGHRFLERTIENNAMNDGMDAAKRTNFSDCGGKKMLLKLLLIARDRPLLFFLMSLPFLLIVVALDVVIMFSIIKSIHLSIVVREIVICLVFLPIAPLFFTIVPLFFEFLVFVVFGALRVISPSLYRLMIWPSDHPRRKFLSSLIAWAEKKRADENRTNASGGK